MLRTNWKKNVWIKSADTCGGGFTIIPLVTVPHLISWLWEGQAQPPMVSYWKNATVLGISFRGNTWMKYPPVRGAAGDENSGATVWEGPSGSWWMFCPSGAAWGMWEAGMIAQFQCMRWQIVPEKLRKVLMWRGLTYAAYTSVKHHSSVLTTGISSRNHILSWSIIILIFQISTMRERPECFAITFCFSLL